MPLFEYVCKKCGHAFEELIRAEHEKPTCPQCGSSQVEKQLSAAQTHSASRARSGSDASLPCGMPPGCCSGQCGLQ